MQLQDKVWCQCDLGAVVEFSAARVAGWVGRRVRLEGRPGAARLARTHTCLPLSNPTSGRATHCCSTAAARGTVSNIPSAMQVVLHGCCLKSSTPEPHRQRAPCQLPAHTAAATAAARLAQGCHTRARTAAAAQLSCTTCVPLPLTLWSWATVTKLYISSCAARDKMHGNRSREARLPNGAQEKLAWHWPRAAGATALHCPPCCCCSSVAAAVVSLLLLQAAAVARAVLRRAQRGHPGANGCAALPCSCCCCAPTTPGWRAAAVPRDSACARPALTALA
jgi:hypothetical protein